MAPILGFALPALGICRSFPRDIVFAPKKYFNLRFQHLYTQQEILRLGDMTKHTFQETITGQLYLGPLKLLHLELGATQPLHKVDFDKLSDLARTSLVKSSWYFLWCYQLYLKTTLSKALPRQGDREIMEGMLSNEVDALETSTIKRCHLYLQAWFLSDITDGSGTFILPEA
jgi:hypothetical protein